jgi:hypothetical protein
MSESLQDEIQDLLFKLELAIRNKIEKEADVTNPIVSRQTSRIYKAGCWLWYGHTYDKNGVCLRCGYKQVKK